MPSDSQPPLFICSTYIAHPLLPVWVISSSALLTTSMEQSPTWKNYNCSPTQEIPHLLWDLKVHYCIHKNLPLVSILSHSNPVCIFPTCFSEIHSNTVLSPTPRSSKWSLSLRFSSQHFICISHLPMSVTWLAHLILLDMITLIIFV